MFLIIAFANNIRYRSAKLVSSPSSSLASLLLLSSTHSSFRFHSKIQTLLPPNRNQFNGRRMRSPILPISVTSQSSTAAAAATMLLLTEEQQQPKARLLSSSSSSSSSLEEEEDHKEKDKRKNKNRFFSRASNFLSSPFLGKNKRTGRRSGSGDTNSSDSLPLNNRQPSLTENVEHAASETFFVTRLCLQLLQYLGLGYKWITKFLALGCYSLLIMPGVLQVAYHYYTSKQIKRDIVYGDKPRNRLDLFVPVDSDGLKPVVAFVTGGAWVIGYKAWGAVLGSQLAEKDIMVACIDYRNFPQSTIGDMVSDASQGISFVCNNIAEYGGDPNRVYVMGQSAGAHISACALVEQASKECKEGGTSWSLSQIKAYFGLSGGYNLLDLVDHFHERGLYRSLFLSIMEGDQSLRRFSPELVVQDPSFKDAVSLMPPVVLFHGDADYTIPSDSSKNFVDTLQKVGAQAELVLYEGKTHTDVFVQDALRGGTDIMVNDVTSYILGGDEEVLAKTAQTPPRRRLVPEFMLKLARMVSPF